MIRRRTDEQILASAAQMDVAIADGLPVDLLAALVQARAHWQTTGDLPVDVFTPEVAAGLAHPAAPAWDALFVTTARRQARKLSVPLRNVQP